MSMRAPARRLTVAVAVLVVAALALGGCGGGSGGGSGGDAGQASGGSAPKTIDVRIADGQVTPSGKRVDVKVGQPIKLVVDSDSADELHVHSSPEHEFEVPAGAQDKVYRFRLDKPGVVEVELHHLDDVVVTLAARP